MFSQIAAYYARTPTSLEVNLTVVIRGARQGRIQEPEETQTAKLAFAHWFTPYF